MPEETPEEESKDRPMVQMVAVRRATGGLADVRNTRHPDLFRAEYPDIDFVVHDMSGKGDPPAIKGAIAEEDYTINPTSGDWEVKTPMAVLNARAKRWATLGLREKVVRLKNRKETALAEGADYAEVATDLQLRIDALLAEIATEEVKYQ